MLLVGYVLGPKMVDGYWVNSRHVVYPRFNKKKLQIVYIYAT